MYLTALPVAALFLSLAHGAAPRSRSNSGDATYYGGNLRGGACMFSTYTLPSGVFGTALSDSNWDTAGNCGACVQVTGPSGNLITAMIVDECPGCGLNHLDLFPDAFAQLADPTKGVMPVTWSIVDCPINSPLQLHNKEGVSQYWFSMQVVNAVKAVSSLEVSTDGGATWTQTSRTNYNFFEHSSGFGTTNVDVKVTSIDGDVVIVNNVEVSSGASTAAVDNFGAGSGSAPMSSAPAVTSSSTSCTTSSSPLHSHPQESSSPTAVVTPASTFTPLPLVVSSTHDTAGSSPTTRSAGQFYTSSPTATNVPAVTSASPLVTSTVTVYSFEGCEN